MEPSFISDRAYEKPLCGHRHWIRIWWRDCRVAFSRGRARGIRAGAHRRHVIPDYGHIDCIFGKNAVKDVYPLILQQLDETA